MNILGLCLILKYTPMNTIDIFLKNDCSINDTAEKLFIHPNTLQYRLNKVKTLCGLDYKKTEDKFILFLCSLIYNMKEQQKTPHSVKVGGNL